MGTTGKLFGQIRRQRERGRRGGSGQEFIAFRRQYRRGKVFRIGQGRILSASGMFSFSDI